MIVRNTQYDSFYRPERQENSNKLWYIVFSCTLIPCDVYLEPSSKQMAPGIRQPREVCKNILAIFRSSWNAWAFWSLPCSCFLYRIGKFPLIWGYTYRYWSKWNRRLTITYAYWCDYWIQPNTICLAKSKHEKLNLDESLVLIILGIRYEHEIYDVKIKNSCKGQQESQYHYSQQQLQVEMYPLMFMALLNYQIVLQINKKQ